MSLVWADGFDHWGTDAQFQTVYQIADSVSLTAVNPRTGTNGLLCSNNRCFWAVSIVPIPQVIFGMAVRQDVPMPPGTAFYFWLMDNGGGILGSVSIDTGNSISVQKANGTVVGTSAPNVLPVGAYNFIEVKWVNSATVGSVQVRVNNITVLLLTGLALSATNIGRIGAGGNHRNVNEVSIPSTVDDFYICSTAGAYGNDFLGDIRCRMMLATANGPAQDWSPHTGNAWQEINRVPVDPTNHFISAPAVGNVSTFTSTQLPTNTSYSAGLMLFVNANKTDAGICGITPGVLSGATVGSIPAISPAIGAAWYTGVQEVDPATGSPWLLPALQAVLSRVERTA